jgi:serine/threonine protein kinase
VNKLPYDYHVDVWGLGVLLYELLHGHSPFKGKTYPEISKKIKENNITFSSSISAEAKELIMKILRVNPVDRVGISDLLEHPWVLRMKRETNYYRRFNEYENQIDKDFSLKNETSPMLSMNDFSRSVSPAPRRNSPPTDGTSKSAMKFRDNSCENHKNTKASSKNIDHSGRKENFRSDEHVSLQKVVSPSPLPKVANSNKQETSYFSCKKKIKCFF